MAAGINQNDIIVAEFFLATVSSNFSAGTYVIPFDVEILGVIMHLGTAPGGSNTVQLVPVNTPTSQAPVANYNLYRAGLSIAGTATTNISASQASVFSGTFSLPTNVPYAFNAPFPGPAGTTGYASQQTAATTAGLSTINPVQSAPLLYEYGLNALTPPNNTYVDLNGVTQPSSIAHEGDVVTFVLVVSGGSAANLQWELVMLKN